MTRLLAKETGPRVVDARFVAGAPTVASLPPAELSEIAFAGRSNVGKSSLLNVLMQRKSLARTSQTPGCTRQLNVFYLRTAEGFACHFVDLPGYGYAKRSKAERVEWGPMIEGYLAQRTMLRGLVLLVDLRRGIEEEERALVEFVHHARGAFPITVAATKMDKVPSSARLAALRAIRNDLPGVQVLGVSAVTGEGRAEFFLALEKSEKSEKSATPNP
ncbi:MAG: ribosome biogenesis GTP-binding protein YihA/YsxC [Myxococcales bacterium]